MRRKSLITGLSTVALSVALLPIVNINASASTVPAKMRGAWYQNLSSVKKYDRTFVKLTANSVRYGSNASQSKFSGANFHISKLKGGWYRIGSKVVSTGDYKLKKIKINGKYHTALLQRYTAKSHYAEVFVRNNVPLPLSKAQYFIG